MTFTIIRIILGLFIWLYLPEFLIRRTKAEKNQKKFFVVCCTVVGTLIVIFSIFSFVNTAINF